MWCLTTRVNPRTDILNPIPGGRGQTFMPAERMTAGEKQWTASNTQFEGGMGIDATMPFGYESDFLRPVYPVDRVKPEDFFTRKTSITRGHAWSVGCTRWPAPGGDLRPRSPRRLGRDPMQARRAGVVTVGCSP